MHAYPCIYKSRIQSCRVTPRFYIFQGQRIPSSTTSRLMIQHWQYKSTDTLTLRNGQISSCAWSSSRSLLKVKLFSSQQWTAQIFILMRVKTISSFSMTLSTEMAVCGSALTLQTWNFSTTTMKSMLVCILVKKPWNMASQMHTVIRLVWQLRNKRKFLQMVNTSSIRYRSASTSTQRSTRKLEQWNTWPLMNSRSAYLTLLIG